MEKPDFKLFYDWDPSDPPRYHCRVIDADYFEWLFSLLEGTGVTFMYRCNLAGRAYYPSKLMSPFDRNCVESANPDAAAWYRLADMLEACDPLAEAVKAGRRHKIPVWAWFNWNEFQNVRPNWVYLVDPVWYKEPRQYWCSRDGSRFYHGVPDFGNPAVKERLAGLAGEILNYGVEGMYLSTRSHSWYACFPSPGWNDHLEDFGFNDCVVEAYREQYGADIRYQDYDRELWHRIKGEHFSALISTVGNLLHRAGVKFVAGLVPDRYSLMGMKEIQPGFKHIQLYKDWEKWAAKGWIDGLCAEQTCPHEKKIAGADISLFRQTVPAGFPVYTWADTACFKQRGGGPFSLVNWDRNSVGEVLTQVKTAGEQDAAGIVLHSLYHFTSVDTAGESIGGYGVLPRTEYLDALRKIQK